MKNNEQILTELVQLADEIRAAQKDYMNDRGNAVLGAAVGRAASNYDETRTLYSEYLAVDNATIVQEIIRVRHDNEYLREKLEEYRCSGHHPFCNYWLTPIGSPGCICVPVTKKDADKLNEIYEMERNPSKQEKLTFWEFTKKCAKEATVEYFKPFLKTKSKEN